DGGDIRTHLAKPGRPAQPPDGVSLYPAAHAGRRFRYSPWRQRREEGSLTLLLDDRLEAKRARRAGPRGAERYRQDPPHRSGYRHDLPTHRAEHILSRRGPHNSRAAGVPALCRTERACRAHRAVPKQEMAPIGLKEHAEHVASDKRSREV